MKWKLKHLIDIGIQLKQKLLFWQKFYFVIFNKATFVMFYVSKLFYTDFLCNLLKLLVYWLYFQYYQNKLLLYNI